MQFYFIDDNKRKGPFTIDELKSLEFNGNTLFWHEGLEDWTEAKKIKQIKKLLKPSKNRRKQLLQLVFSFIIISVLVFVFFCVRKNKKCIYGNCDNGFGIAIFLNGNQNNAGFNDIYGFNIYDWDDNDRYKAVYIGEWKNGKRDGIGLGLNDLCYLQLAFGKYDEEQIYGRWENDKYEFFEHPYSKKFNCGSNYAYLAVNLFLEVGGIDMYGDLHDNESKFSSQTKNSKTFFLEKARSTNSDLLKFLSFFIHSHMIRKNGGHWIDYEAYYTFQSWGLEFKQYE